MLGSMGPVDSCQMTLKAFQSSGIRRSGQAAAIKLRKSISFVVSQRRSVVSVRHQEAEIRWEFELSAFDGRQSLLAFPHLQLQSLMKFQGKHFKSKARGTFPLGSSLNFCWFTHWAPQKFSKKTSGSASGAWPADSQLNRFFFFFFPWSQEYQEPCRFG